MKHSPGKTAAVIGAGLGGLALAIRLQSAGIATTVFEKRDKPGGRAYVYRIYGLHWCFNIVCDRDKPGSAVLIRALEPRAGLDRMRARRGVQAETALCSGPAKLCQALGIDQALNGADLQRPPFLFAPPPIRPDRVEGVRVGITRGADTPWRFGLAGSPFLSRPFPRR